MENREYLNSLFDIYKELFTQIEQITFIDYYVEDLSLTEIATNRNITKASVSKTLKQVTTKLKEYEQILHIYNHNLIIKKLLEENDLTKIKAQLLTLI